MLKHSKPDLVKSILSNGPKQAKEIAQAFEEEGISESTAFYWLKKLQEEGEIRKVGSKYELVSLEEADEEELEFLLEKLNNGSPVAKAAAEDLRIMCNEKKVSHFDRIWSFIDNTFKNSYGEEIRRKGIQALHSIALNSAMIGDEEAVERIREEFRGKLEKVVLDEDLSFASRELAAEVLNLVLEGGENFQAHWDILSQLLKSEDTMSVSLTIWRRLLDEHFDDRRLEIRENLYSLLENGDSSVREAVLFLFDELRAQERRFA